MPDSNHCCCCANTPCDHHLLLRHILDFYWTWCVQQFWATSVTFQCNRLRVQYCVHRVSIHNYDGLFQYGDVASFYVNRSFRSDLVNMCIVHKRITALCMAARANYRNKTMDIFWEHYVWQNHELWNTWLGY